MNSTRLALEAAFAQMLPPLTRRWRTEADRTLSELGLSHASGWALIHAGRLAQPVTQSALGEAMDLKGPSVVRLIDRLEADGLLERQADSQDRRVNHLVLTDAGLALRGRIESALSRIRHEVLGEIDDGALKATVDVLRIVDSLLLDRQGRSR